MNDETTQSVPNEPWLDGFETLRELYGDTLSDDELKDAAHNLVMFFKALLAEDERRRAEQDLREEQLRSIPVK